MGAQELSFSLLFEAFAMTLVMLMPVAVAAERFLEIIDQRLWRVVFHYVGAAVARHLADVKHLCIDETAAKRGQDYITLVVDIDARRVAFVTEGRNADTISQFADRLEVRGGGDASRIKQACIDMSPAYIGGVTENLTQAEITFDRFHVMKLIVLVLQHRAEPPAVTTTRLNLIAVLPLHRGSSRSR